MLNIQVDSRKIKEGDTFVALRGINSDGHDYIDIAIRNGAKKIVAEYGEYPVETLIVQDTRSYLEEYLISNYSEIIDKMKLIGITGTNGKTTTAFLLYQALNKAKIKTAYMGTIGLYHKKKIKDLPNTTPDILETYEVIVDAYHKGYEVLVLEASSQGLDARRLENIMFDYTIFTNLTADHLDHHITMENYADAKKKLFKNMKIGGKAIINIDDKYSNNFILSENQNITFGKNTADYQITTTKKKQSYTHFEVIHKKETRRFKTKLIGEFNIYNLVPVIVILDDLNKNPITIIDKLESPKGRLDNYHFNKRNVIVDYAHSNDSVEKVIEAVKKITDKNIVVVFGCTGNRDREKRPIMTQTVLTNTKHAIITIDDLYDEDPNQIVSDMLENNNLTNYSVELDRGKAIRKGFKLLEEEDYLLILGKGHEEFIKVGKEKIPFSDNKIVEAIKKEGNF